MAVGVPSHQPPDRSYMARVAGRIDIAWHVNTTLELAFPLYGTDPSKFRWDFLFQENDFPLHYNELKDAVCVLTVKDKKWSDQPEDKDALIKWLGKVECRRHQITGKVISTSVTFDVPHSQMVLTPGDYKYSVDMALENPIAGAFPKFIKVFKIAHGDFKLLPNTNNQIPNADDPKKIYDSVTDVNIRTLPSDMFTSKKTVTQDTEGYTKIVNFDLDITNLRNWVQGEITNINNALTALANRVSTVEGDITSLAARVARLEPWIEALEAVYTAPPAGRQDMMDNLSWLKAAHDRPGRNGMALVFGNINHISGADETFGLFGRAKGSFGQTGYPDLRSDA